MSGGGFWQILILCLLFVVPAGLVAKYRLRYGDSFLYGNLVGVVALIAMHNADDGKAFIDYPFAVIIGQIIVVMIIGAVLGSIYFGLSKIIWALFRRERE